MLITNNIIHEGCSVAEDKSAEPQITVSLLRSIVEARLRASLPGGDARELAERDALIRVVIDEIVAQCKNDPMHALQIAESAIQAALSGLRSQVAGAHERLHHFRERLGGAIKAARSQSKHWRKDFTQDAATLDLGALENEGLPYAAELERALNNLFEQGRLPEGMEFVIGPAGELYLRIRLQGHPDGSIMLPAENIRMLKVSRDAAWNYHIVEYRSPAPARFINANAVLGDVHVSRRELVLSEAKIRSQLGLWNPSTTSLSAFLGEHPQASESLFAHYEAMKFRELKDYLSELSVSSQCFPMQEMPPLPAALLPMLPEFAQLARLHGPLLHPA